MVHRRARRPSTPAHRANWSGASAPRADNCIIILQLATNTPTPHGHPDSPEFFIVPLAAFPVRQGTTPNTHGGTLLDNDLAPPPLGTGAWSGANGWTLGDGEVATVRLTK